MLTTEIEQTLNTEIGEAIRSASVEVFSTMLAMDISAGETAVTKTPDGKHPGVVALLGMTGEWAGSGQLSCAPGFACKIASQMLMAEYDTVDDDVLDAMAEIANMIVGNIKNMMEVNLGPMGLSTPTVVHGGNFDTRIAGNPERVIVPLTCGDEIMTVQIVLTRKHGASAIRERHRTPELALAG